MIFVDGHLRGLRIRTKLLLLLLPVIAAIAVVILVLLPRELERAARKATLENAHSIADMAAFSVGPAMLFDDRTAAREALGATLRNADVVSVALVDLRGKPFVSLSRPGKLPSLQFEVSSQIVAGHPVGTLRLMLTMQRFEGEVAAARRTALFAALLVFFAGGVAVMTISFLIAAPVSNITKAAAVVASGDFSARATVRANDEVGVLAATFNSMVEAVARSREALHDVNQQLETRVAERTAELIVEVREREQLGRELRLILESTHDGIFGVDANGRCTLVNPAAACILRRDAESISGADLHEILEPECKDPQCPVAALLVDASREAATVDLHTPDGTAVSAEISCAPILDAGVRVGSVVTLRDVTERESLRRNLEDARRLASMGNLAAMMAHEFNNVLMGIQALAEVVLRQTAAMPRVAKAGDSILQAVRRGKRVTEEVLRFTRPRDPVKKVLDVRLWLSDLVPSLRPMVASKGEIDVELPTQPVNVRIDREQIEQVIANLVANGRDAIAPGGRITIRVTESPTADRVAIDVIDTGEGIPAEILPRIFEPFFSTKRAGGTGLGLAITRQIVDRHGGSITVESHPGRTRFRIELPTSGAAPEQRSERVVAASRSLRVLMVEDDEIVADGLEAMLALTGHEVIAARSGAEALQAVNSEAPDLVLLDVGLPDADGVDVYRRIAEQHPRLPVIFSTGHADERRLRETLAQPHVAFLLKPYSAAELTDALARVTGVRRSDPIPVAPSDAN